MKLNEIKDMIYADTISIRDGIITARWGFFYTSGRTFETYVQKVLHHFPNAEIIDHGEVWKNFRGGASVANQSHWFVKFRLR